MPRTFQRFPLPLDQMAALGDPQLLVFGESSSLMLELPDVQVTGSGIEPVDESARTHFGATVAVFTTAGRGLAPAVAEEVGEAVIGHSSANSAPELVLRLPS